MASSLMIFFRSYYIRDIPISIINVEEKIIWEFSGDGHCTLKTAAGLIIILLPLMPEQVLELYLELKAYSQIEILYLEACYESASYSRQA